MNKIDECEAATLPQTLSDQNKNKQAASPFSTRNLERNAHGDAQ